MTIGEFVDWLAGQNPPCVCSTNLYQCPKKKNNLKAYLEKMASLKPTILFLGEAPGHKGCGVTGIPFTDEKAIKEIDFFKDGNYEISDEPQIEQTAGNVWEVLNKCTANIPLLWNIYPFHPFNCCKPNSNRKPCSKEIEFGKKVVEKLLSIDPFCKITKKYAIGRSAQEYDKNVMMYIRHPSYGWQKEFEDGAKKALALK